MHEENKGIELTIQNVKQWHEERHRPLEYAHHLHVAATWRARTSVGSGCFYGDAVAGVNQILDKLSTWS